MEPQSQNKPDVLIHSAMYLPSPHWDERPPETEISLLVIHSISLPPGEFGGQYVHALFLNTLPVEHHPYFSEIAHLKVSSHLFIDREGKIWQFVPLDKRAWHAGASVFAGRANCNDYSIGIELEGTDDIPYTDAQYGALAAVTQRIQRLYPAITIDRIVGHSDIAPGRKTDPGMCFDWVHYREKLNAIVV